MHYSSKLIHGKLFSMYKKNLLVYFNYLIRIHLICRVLSNIMSSLEILCNILGSLPLQIMTQASGQYTQRPNSEDDPCREWDHQISRCYSERNSFWPSTEKKNSTMHWSCTQQNHSEQDNIH